MDLIGNANIRQAIEDLQTYPEYRKVLSVLLKNEIYLLTYPEYRKVLSVLLKNEIYLLLQRLSETGEESIVMTASVSDGSMSVIGSNFGERFVLEPGNAVNLVTGFKEQFARYCHNGAGSPNPPKRARRYSYHQYSSIDTTSSYPVDEGGEISNAAIKARLKQKSLRDKREEFQDPVYNQDDSDKAIDETVSELVKNIFKESEERERELGENGGRRRRRRRRRTFVDQNYSQNGVSCGRRAYRKQKEIRIAQFFPTIPLKRVDSVINNADKQATTSSGIQIKTEPVDCFLPDMQQKSNMIRRRRGSKRHEKREILPLESVDKSIQKIIDMETGCQQPDSSLNEFEDESVEKSANEEQKGNDEEYIEEKVKRIMEQVAKESESKNEKAIKKEADKGTKGNLESVKENTLSQNTLAEMTVKKVTSSDKICKLNISPIKPETIGENTEGGHAKGEEVDPLNEEPEKMQMSDEIKKETPVFEIEVDKDETNLSNEDNCMKNGDELAEQVNQSFEDSGGEDWPEEVYSPGYRRKVSRNFVHNGYSYIRDKAGKGNTVYWKCGRIGCKGRVIQRGGEKIRTQDHNHNPSLDLEVSRTHFLVK